MSPLIVMQSEIMIELSNPQKIKSYTITLFSFKKKKSIKGTKLNDIPKPEQFQIRHLSDFSMRRRQFKICYDRIWDCCISVLFSFQGKGGPKPEDEFQG